jgi:hypothetical protein
MMTLKTHAADISVDVKGKSRQQAVTQDSTLGYSDEDK